VQLHCPSCIDISCSITVPWPPCGVSDTNIHRESVEGNVRGCAGHQVVLWEALRQRARGRTLWKSWCLSLHPTVSVLL
jgi:hypothetical protein